MNKLIVKKYLDVDKIICLCDCGGTDHLLQISRWNDEKDCPEEFIVNIVHTHFGLWFRIKQALKYIITGEEGFDEIILHREQVKELVDTLTNILKRRKSK